MPLTYYLFGLEINFRSNFTNRRWMWVSSAFPGLIFIANLQTLARPYHFMIHLQNNEAMIFDVHVIG